MGNEACDLDSGVSAVCLAYHRSTSYTTLPVLNIMSEDFPLKTELVAVMAEEDIHAADLIFRDTIDLARFPNLSLILVDHNVLAEADKDLQGKVIEIYDHHVRETSMKENVTIEPVGSCASLILRSILAENPDFRDPSCLQMIRKTILLDTVGLRPEAKRVTSTDIEMVDKAEALLCRGPEDREEVFNWVMKEKSRVDHLTPGQLLKRDLKVVVRDSVRVALCSVPVLCCEFIKLKDWADHADTFMQRGSYTAVVFLGFHLADTGVCRDLMVGGRDTQLVDKIKEAVETCSEPCLDVEIITDSPDGVSGFRQYKQGNQAASRKQILPIVKSIV